MPAFWLIIALYAVLITVWKELHYLEVRGYYLETNLFDFVYIMELYPIKRSYCDNTYNMIMGLSSSSLSIGGIFNVLAIYSNVMYSGLVTSLRLST